MSRVEVFKVYSDGFHRVLDRSFLLPLLPIFMEGSGRDR